MASDKRRIPISTQRDFTCVTDTFFTILEFSDITRKRFMELRDLISESEIERVSDIYNFLRTHVTFGPSFEIKKAKISPNDKVNAPFIAHLIRSTKRNEAFSTIPNYRNSLDPSHPFVRKLSLNAGEGTFTKDLVTSITGPFGTTPVGKGCRPMDIKNYGNEVLKKFFGDEFNIYENPDSAPDTTFGIILGLEDPLNSHMIGLLQHNGVWHLSDNEVGFLHEIRDVNFINNFVYAYANAVDKTNIDTIYVFFIPPDKRSGDFIDLQFSFYIPALNYTYGIPSYDEQMTCTTTLFLTKDHDVALAVGGGASGGAGAENSMFKPGTKMEINSRRSRKNSRQYRKYRRSRRSQRVPRSFK